MIRNMLIKIVKRLASKLKPEKSSLFETLDAYTRFSPNNATAFSIFEGEWSCEIPGFGQGAAKVFEDPRVEWLEKTLGGFKGLNILELGPLEAGHTYMMATRGAGRITAIESNVRAFLKCLIVKNALEFEADFMLGDFNRHLAETSETYDFILASGVLYHMHEPHKLIEAMCAHSNAIGIWTHYYDEKTARNHAALRERTTFTPLTLDFRGAKIEMHKFQYKQSLKWKGFCGGPEHYSYWLSRQSLLDIFDKCGFEVTVGDDTLEHPNGPCMTLMAKKR